jgi:hypothetical protein
MSDDLDRRLLRGQIGGCTCDTMTPELGAHDPQCKYRLCADAAATIARLRADLAAVTAERDRAREALERIAAPIDCGCNPCRGDCTSDAAKAIYFDEARDTARSALQHFPETKDA